MTPKELSNMPIGARPWSHDHYERSAQDGMTYRQWLVAHAPTEIPDWFPLDLIPKDYDHDRFKFLSDAHKTEEQFAEWKALQVKYFAWMAEYEHSRYFQWRTFYADNMIVELCRSKSAQNNEKETQ